VLPLKVLRQLSFTLGFVVSDLVPSDAPVALWAFNGKTILTEFRVLLLDVLRDAISGLVAVVTRGALELGLGRTIVVGGG
jgi:hypothetical protein